MSDTLKECWAVRWAAPEEARMAMCMPVNPACIAVPSGDRPAYSLGEGHQVLQQGGTDK